MRSQKPAKFIQKCETVNDVIMINGWFGLKEKRVVKVRDNDLIFYSKILDVKIVVKEWYVSDGASVPQILWNIFPPFGSYLYAAIIHDRRFKMEKSTDVSSSIISRPTMEG
jgi:hypothetical protein